MSIIRDVFGKEDNIILDDLTKILNVTREGYLIEGKSIKEHKDGIEQKKKGDIKEDCILRPIIGFLNSDVGKGLLILGVDTDKKDTSLITGISGIDSDYTSESIESLIKEYVISCPKIKNPYTFLIKPIIISPLENVYLIEIEILENNCMFYSGKTKASYVRKGASVERLSPEEFVVMLEKRICSRVFIEIDSEKVGTIKDHPKKFIYAHKGQYPLHIAFRNTGFEPCKDAWAMLIFSNSDISIATKDKHGYINPEESLYGVTRFSVHSNISNAGGNILYPNAGVKTGVLNVKENPMKDFELNIRTFSEKGYTIQRFTFGFTSKTSIPFGKAVLIMEEDMSKREFVSYISNLGR